MKKFILFIFIFLSVISNNMLYADQNSATTSINQKSDDKLSVDMMKQDVDFIVDWIKTHHPEVIKYGFSKEQKGTIDFVYENINKSMSKNEFFFIINRLFAMLNDGLCELYHSPQNTLYLDIPFVWLEEGMIITKNTGNFKIGDKIISIGNKSSDELISLIKQQVSAENTYCLRENAYEILTSKAYLEHFKLINDNDTVNIVILRNEISNGESSTKVLEFKEKFKQSLTSRIGLSTIRTPIEWIDWYIEKDNNLGYFRFDYWPPNGEDYEELKKQLDNFFIEVFKNGIKNIGFDMRRNAGGVSSAMYDILSYLKTDKVYLSSFKELYQFIPKKSELFDGSVYFLTSNKSYGCAVFVLTVLNDNKIVKTIGEPTGQKPAFNFHELSSDGKLPNTGWEFTMTASLNTRPMDIKAEDSLYPDIAINTTSNDILNSSDPQMFKLRQLSNTSLKKNIIKKQVFTGQFGNITIKNSDYFNIDMKNKTINARFNNNEIKKDDINFFLVEKDKKALTYTINHDNKSATINIDEKSVIGQKYLLTINADDNIEYHIEFIIESKLKITSSSHTKFGYMLFNFSNDAKEIVQGRIKIFDENNNALQISETSIVHEGRTLLVSLTNKFTSGKTYKLYIPKNTIKFTDEYYNTEDLYYIFKIGN